MLTISCGNENAGLHQIWRDYHNCRKLYLFQKRDILSSATVFIPNSSCVLCCKSLHYIDLHIAVFDK